MGFFFNIIMPRFSTKIIDIIFPSISSGCPIFFIFIIITHGNFPFNAFI